MGEHHAALSLAQSDSSVILEPQSISEADVPKHTSRSVQ